MKIEFEIEDYEIVDILKGDDSFPALLKAKILCMEDLSSLAPALVEAAKAAVVEHLKKQILDNLFEVKTGYGLKGQSLQWHVLKENARYEISDIAKAHMYEAVQAIIAEREDHTRQAVESKFKEVLRGFDPEKVMVQAAKELLRESMKAADNQTGSKA